MVQACVNQAYKNEMLHDALKNIYAIDRDCEDEEFMRRTVRKVEKVIELFNAKNIAEMKIRNELLDYLYDLHEYLTPHSACNRFEIIKRIVKNISSNNGDFDHNPLNIAARRMEYFMKSIPVNERYKLALEIKRKTKDSKTYNYDRFIHNLAQEYEVFKVDQKYQEHLEKLERYDEIRNLLSANPDNKTQIELFNELLPLVNEQEWGRTRKFGEKKTIYNHLARLYRTEGMLPESSEAEAQCEQFRKAGKHSEIAATIKGYSFSKYKSGGR